MSLSPQSGYKVAIVLNSVVVALLLGSITWAVLVPDSRPVSVICVGLMLVASWLSLRSAHTHAGRSPSE